MPKYSTYEMGICDVEECGGWTVEEKGTHDIVCNKCHKRWDSVDWETLVQLTREKEYEVGDSNSNLKRLNNL